MSELSSLYLLHFIHFCPKRDPRGPSGVQPQASPPVWYQDLWPGVPLRCSPLPSIILLPSLWFSVGLVCRRAPNGQVRLSLPSGEAAAAPPGGRTPPLKTVPTGLHVERPESGERSHSHFCPLIPEPTDSAGERGHMQSTHCNLFSPDPTLPGYCLPSGTVTESSKGHSTLPFIQRLLSGGGCGKTRELRGRKSIASLHLL